MSKLMQVLRKSESEEVFFADDPINKRKGIVVDGKYYSSTYSQMIQAGEVRGYLEILERIVK